MQIPTPCEEWQNEVLQWYHQNPGSTYEDVPQYLKDKRPDGCDPPDPPE